MTIFIRAGFVHQPESASVEDIMAIFFPQANGAGTGRYFRSAMRQPVQQPPPFEQAKAGAEDARAHVYAHHLIYIILIMRYILKNIILHLTTVKILTKLD